MPNLQNQAACLRVIQDAEIAVRSLPHATARSAEYADLAGERGADSYRHALNALRRMRQVIGQAERELCELDGHPHKWNEAGTCDVCGADGRA